MNSQRLALVTGWLMFRTPEHRKFESSALEDVGGEAMQLRLTSKPDLLKPRVVRQFRSQDKLSSQKCAHIAECKTTKNEVLRFSRSNGCQENYSLVGSQ